MTRSLRAARGRGETTVNRGLRTVARRPRADHRAAARRLAFGIALLIAWGSLYPLEFRALGNGELERRLLHAGSRIFSRADLIANLLLYIPFGAACRLAAGGSGNVRRIALAALLGSALSLSLELMQLATPHRVTSIIDWSLNSAGALLGAVAVALYLRIGSRWRFASLRDPRPALVPCCLLALWITAEFAPYAPARHAVPVGELLAAFAARHAFSAARWSLSLTRWWIIAECVRHIWRRPWAMLILAALIALTALDQTYIGADRRSLEELLSWCIVPLAALLTSGWSPRARAWWTIAGCGVVLLTTNVWALAPGPRTGVFHWIPFSGTLLATRDYRPLLDGLFLNGALLWSLMLALRSLPAAFIVTFAASIAVELAHLWTPPHRAEITDPLLVVALLAAFLMARRFQAYAFGADGAPAPRPQGLGTEPDCR